MLAAAMCKPVLSGVSLKKGFYPFHPFYKPYAFINWLGEWAGYHSGGIFFCVLLGCGWAIADTHTHTHTQSSMFWAHLETGSIKTVCAWKPPNKTFLYQLIFTRPKRTGGKKNISRAWVTFHHGPDKQLLKTCIKSMSGVKHNVVNT